MHDEGVVWAGCLRIIPHPLTSRTAESFCVVVCCKHTSLPYVQIEIPRMSVPCIPLANVHIGTEQLGHAAGARGAVRVLLLARQGPAGHLALRRRRHCSPEVHVAIVALRTAFVVRRSDVAHRFVFTHTLQQKAFAC